MTKNSGASVVKRSDLESGQLVASLLTGSWREAAPEPSLTEDQLAQIAPLLCQSGGAALAWWRIRQTHLAQTEAGEQLHQAYRQFRLAALIHEHEIAFVISLLRAEDIEPVLVKGWAVARLYPELGLRPYGDIDLCVHPAQFARAARLLTPLEDIDGHYVDLHSGFDEIGREKSAVPSPAQRGEVAERAAPAGPWSISSHSFRGSPEHRGDASWSGPFDRSEVFPLPSLSYGKPGRIPHQARRGMSRTVVRVLSEEDHLRSLCLHLLRSGAWRPLWLCDVALAVETRKSNFDWDICLGDDSRHRGWVIGTLGLARDLLGADVSDTPGHSRITPRWLLEAVLRQWDRCRNSHVTGRALPPLLMSLRKPKTLMNELYVRWDNPVRSSVALRRPFDQFPRWPYQLGELILRSPEAARQLATMIRRNE